DEHCGGRDLHRRGQGRAASRRGSSRQAMKADRSVTAVGERPEGGARATAPPPPVSGDTRRRVLLIEDDADIAEAIGYQMEKAGLPRAGAAPGPGAAASRAQ